MLLISQETYYINVTCEDVPSVINAVDGLEVEYYEIVDRDTLLPTDEWKNAVGCVTVYCGPVRLIDNIQY